MKKSICFLFVVVAFLTTLASAQSDAERSYGEIKSLAGRWQSKASNGKTVTVSFRETAGGSAVLSEIEGQGPEDMVTMFHLDGPNKLLLTHYCGAGNQPRMQATTSADGKTITFTFLDATNLASPDAGHMQSLVIAMLDANHHTEQWTFVDHGKEIKESFDLRRR